MADPEAYLASLEPLGWRLGLERMQRLTSLLGLPQRRFASIHVVGTNGKTSVTLMIAALLEAHGLSTGAYISPHLHRWAERIQLRGQTIDGPAFAAALDRTAEAAAVVNRAMAPEAVTQFEAVTAAAFVAFAEAKVEIAVVEAGLGGRLDATNVIPSAITVLTSVGLDHTQWLGDTVEEIADEKLAVLNDHTILVSGELSGGVDAKARHAADHHHAKLLHAPAVPPASLVFAAPGAYQQRNFALACTAVEAFLGRIDLDAADSVAAGLRIPGRLELLDGDPPMLLDAAHNPAGAAALAEAVPEIAGGRAVVACIGVLADKDAAGIVTALAAVCDAVICTEPRAEALRASGRPGAEAMPASHLAQLAETARAKGVETVPDAGAAIARARELARELGGIAIVSGSHYLLAEA